MDPDQVGAVGNRERYRGGGTLESAQSLGGLLDIQSFVAGGGDLARLYAGLVPLSALPDLSGLVGSWTIRAPEVLPRALDGGSPAGLDLARRLHELTRDRRASGGPARSGKEHPEFTSTDEVAV